MAPLELITAPQELITAPWGPLARVEFSSSRVWSTHLVLCEVSAVHREDSPEGRPRRHEQPALGVLAERALDKEQAWRGIANVLRGHDAIMHLPWLGRAREGVTTICFGSV